MEKAGQAMLESAAGLTPLVCFYSFLLHGGLDKGKGIPDLFFGKAVQGRVPACIAKALSDMSASLHFKLLLESAKGSGRGVNPLGNEGFGCFNKIVRLDHPINNLPF